MVSTPTTSSSCALSRRMVKSSGINVTIGAISGGVTT